MEEMLDQKISIRELLFYNITFVKSKAQVREMVWSSNENQRLYTFLTPLVCFYSIGWHILLIEQIEFDIFKYSCN